MTNKYNHQIANGFKAIAPYNFVPLPESVFVAPSEEQEAVNDRYLAGRHTGYLVLQLKTETPLYTRCAYPPTVPVDDDGKPKVTKVPECQEFFHHGKTEEPVIPGSSLRGMARSLLEIIAYAKVINVSDKQFVHRAVGDPTSHGRTYRGRLANVRAGYLLEKSDGYYINPAKPRSGKTFGRVEQNDLIRLGKGNYHEVFDGYISATGRNDFGRTIHSVSDSRTRTETEQATILTTGKIDLNPGSTRKSFAIYERDRTRELRIPSQLWDLYEEDCKKSLLQSPIRKLENDGDPLFYLSTRNKSGNEIIEYFGSTMMFRVPYNPKNCEPHRISDFIPASDQLDLAETIFGRIRQNTSKTRAGRVFFTDAVWRNRDEYPFFSSTVSDDGRRVPKILASPKPTSFQLYLNQPEVIPKQNNQDQDGTTLKSYYDKGETLIRGTKLYWSKKALAQEQHSESFTQNSDGNLPRTRITASGVQIEGEEGISSQHTIIRPVKAGIMFESRVYFENLTTLEVGALLTALDLTSSALPSSKRHRLGMGKPLGLGTIEIKTELFLQNRSPQKVLLPKARYELLFDGIEDWHTGERGDSKMVADESKKAFRQRILEHHNCAVSNPQVDLTKDDLTEIPRLKALFDLLEWDAPVQESHTRYLDPNNPNDKDIIRRRYVLPNPHNFIARSAEYKYEVQVSEQNAGAETAPGDN